MTEKETIKKFQEMLDASEFIKYLRVELIMPDVMLPLLKAA